MFWDVQAETMSRADIESVQLTRLRKTVSHIWENAPYQRKKLEDAGVCPESIQSLEDLRKIPFTVKDDFRDNYPLGLLAVPRKEVVRLQGTSGTTGKSTIGAYTRQDLQVWAQLIARLASAVNVTAEDTAHICFGYGLFTGGFGLHQGMELIGATVLPMSAGNTERQLVMMEDMESTVLICTPSYALYISEVVREKGLKERLKLRVGLFGGEGCTPEMRETIERNLGIIATNNYGMCELTGPGVSGECEKRDGLHFAEDHFIPEIIDPETGKVLPAGAVGELVITPLSKEAMPVLRYRTRDITKLEYAPCACGRTHVRMSPTLGRSDDMLIIRGVNVFPSQIESVLIGLPHIGPHYLLKVRREGFADTLEVLVELIDGSVLEHFSMLEAIQRNIEDKLYAVLGLRAKVTLVQPNSVERFQGKAKRVVDLR